MNLIFALSVFLVTPLAYSQIADTSFFPSVRSINPGVAARRSQGLTSLDVSKTEVEKVHDITAGGIQDGIRTDVNLQKNTFFFAHRFGVLNFEVVVDRETGEKTERIQSTTYGNRDVVNEAASTYAGAMVGMKFLGFSLATANYETDYKFRVGEPPDVSAKDINTEIDYNLFKFGTAFRYKNFTFGAFGMKKNSEEKYTYTYYDPSTGAKGSTEVWPAESSAEGYGFGLGYTSKKFRFEVSSEHMDEADVEFNSNPMDVINISPISARASVGAEIRFGKLSLGGRWRTIAGNFTDLEDLISSKLLYEEMAKKDLRNEASFNFGYGSEKGWTLSAFYTQSKSKTKEESTIFANGEKYPAVTKSKAFGANVSYYF